MSTIKDGGPAFPNTVKITDENFADLRGMTLRDYFAAKAMATLLATEYRSDQGLTESWPKQLAGESYQIADAMLRAREAGQ